MSLDSVDLNHSVASLNELSSLPIIHQYEKVNEYDIQQLKKHANVLTVSPSENIKVVNIYYRDKVKGSLPQLYTRESLWIRLLKIAELLKPHAAGLLIYDTFRTIETQKELFQQFYDQIKELHPELNDTEWDQLTRMYVSHPTDKTHNEIPLHNSGGAVDLAIYDIKTGEQWDFGSVFDDPEEISHTRFFEGPFDPSCNISESRWFQVQKNRRIFFHLMKQQGFINYQYEWWHYDLGDCYWSKVLGTPWVYESMEAEVNIT